MFTYKKTETPIITFKISSEVYLDKIYGMLDDIVNLNICCVFLAFDLSDMLIVNKEKYHQMINCFSKKGIDIFAIISIDNINNIEQIVELENIIITNVNTSQVEELCNVYPNAFLTVNFSVKEVDDVIKQRKVHDNIILNPSINYCDCDEYNYVFGKIFSSLSGEDIMLDPIILPISQIKDHPCNVYLCDGSNCHSSHSSVARNIFVDAKGDAWIYGFFPKNRSIGNIYNNSLSSIIDTYKVSDDCKMFVAANRKLFMDVIDKYYLSTIPWFKYLEASLNNE